MTAHPERLLASLTGRRPGVCGAVLAEHVLAMAGHGLGTDDTGRLAVLAAGRPMTS